MTEPKPLNKEDFRCPFCNISGIDIIKKDAEGFEIDYNEGFRYYCSYCEKVFYEPVVGISNINSAVEWLVKEVKLESERALFTDDYCFLELFSRFLPNKIKETFEGDDRR